MENLTELVTLVLSFAAAGVALFGFIAVRTNNKRDDEVYAKLKAFLEKAEAVNTKKTTK